MKATIFITVLIVSSLFSLPSLAQISSCYLNFNKANNLKMKDADHLPAEANHTRKLITDNGEVDITAADAYRILYYNRKNVAFVNLKVETSAAGNYETDKNNVLANLRFLNSHSANMETKELIELSYNGFKIYGLSRNSTESGSTLGTFVMFPGNNTIVYFYFNNIRPEYANFKDLTDYKSQRNDFIGRYTSYLNTCKQK